MVRYASLAKTRSFSKIYVFIIISLIVALVSCTAVIVRRSQSVEAAPTGLPSGFSATVLSNFGMGTPTSVRVAPNGRVFVFDLYGSIKIFNTSTSSFNAQPFGSVTVDATGDRGLLGAAFDPDFANNPYLYIHYVGSDDKVRIGRFDASGDTGTNFTVLYTAPLASGFQHAGGGITVGLDGKVYFGIGDSGTPTNSQDLTKSHGKIHRINRDGSVPTNPFAGQANVPNTIYAYGVRNPFRLTTDKLTGDVYVGDVGFNTWEEINLLTSGANYGWATQEGPCTSTCSFTNPVYWYPHQFGTNNTNDASIVAGPVYRGNVYPASYYGKMFISDYVQGFLRTITPTTTSNAFTTFSTANGPIIDMDTGPDGKLYFVTIASPVLYRLDYSGGPVNNPPVANSSASTTGGPAPLTVNFSSAGSSDPEGQGLTYNWNFGDGTSSTSANPTKTFNVEGSYAVTLTVSDGTNNATAVPINIQVGNLPTVTIQSPLATQKYNGGQTINYAATAVDANGNNIPNSQLSTTVKLYHSDHNHPFLGPIPGGNGQITTPTDCELSPDVWLRITITATDSQGFTNSSYVEIHPNISQITVNTSPAGLNVVLDGSNHIIPPTVQGVVNMNRQIAAPSPQIFQGQQYVFDHWSDGGARDHTFNFPATTTTYTAYYVPSTTSGNYVNLVSNPSFETLNGQNALDWTYSRWGTNNAAFSLSSDANTGVRSARMEASSLTSGEGRLNHKAVNITSGTTYGVRYFYKSNVQMKAVADVTLNDNSHKYIWLGISQPNANSWKEQNWTFVAPANSKNVSVSLYLTTVGFVQIDDFNVLEPSSGSVSTPVSVQLSAAPTTVNAGQAAQLTWSTQGQGVTCQASNGWSGVKSTTGTESVNPTATTTYTITCADSLTSDTKSVTVTVNQGQPVPTGNIVPNPSTENRNGASPIDWASSKWGTNTSTFTHVQGGAYDGDYSLLATVTGFSSGEAKWQFTPQDVQPNTLYTFSEFAKSNGPTKVLVDITRANGSHTYMWLGTLPTTTTWTEFKKTFTTPADATKVTVGTFMTGAGSFQIDKVSLTPPAPSVVNALTLQATPPAINEGQSTTLAWNNIDGSASCTATGAWSGAKSAGGSEVVSPTVTSTYTLTCTSPTGNDTKSVTVNVTPALPSLVNLIVNPTFFDVPTGTAIPNGWYQGSWGTNTTTYSNQTAGRTDNSSLALNVTDYISGDAKWFFEPVTIVDTKTYTYSHWYKSNSPTELLAEYTLGNGTKAYEWLGFLDAAADWTQVSKTLTPPTGATKVTVFHMLKANGALELDDFSLTAN